MFIAHTLPTHMTFLQTLWKMMWSVRRRPIEVPLHFPPKAQKATLGLDRTGSTVPKVGASEVLGVPLCSVRTRKGPLSFGFPNLDNKWQIDKVATLRVYRFVLRKNKSPPEQGEEPLFIAGFPVQGRGFVDLLFYCLLRGLGSIRGDFWDIKQRDQVAFWMNLLPVCLDSKSFF